VTFNQSQLLWGFTTGAGIEYGLTPNFVLGVEYDITSFHPGTHSGVASNSGSVTFGASSFDVQSVVGRVSYKF
jgi:outer membrane immunogenic protein